MKVIFNNHRFFYHGIGQISRKTLNVTGGDHRAESNKRPNLFATNTANCMPHELTGITFTSKQ